MTGKILDSGAPVALVLILPIALVMVVLFTAWPLLLGIIALGIGWKVWENYQWQKWCKQVNPYFYQLIKANQGCLTVMDLSLKANLSGRAAKQFLDKKAEEYGAQRKEIEEKGTVYYFLTASALGSIFDDSEPSTELESERSTAPTTPEEFTNLSQIMQQLDEEAASETHRVPKGNGQQVASKETEHVSDTSSPIELEREKVDEDISEDPFLEEESAIREDHSDDRQEGLVLIQAELAKRLDLNPSTVARRKSDPDFAQWSQSKDPDGIAWKYVAETKMFVPQEESEESS